jgi:2-aminoadipate transaminase
MSFDWQPRFARRLEWMTTSAIRDILKCAQTPGLISLSGGWPEADLFPTRQLAEIAQDVLQRMPCESLQYGLTDGFPPLRALLAEYMTAQGIIAKAENIVITSGTQQSLDLLGRILLDEGDSVLVENPTFLGALQSFKAYGARFVATPLDNDGVDVTKLNQDGCKFYYALPTFQNPTGVTLSLERRQTLIKLAVQTGLVIVEDDPYSVLRFEGQPLPSLAALASQEVGGTPDNILYCSSFSKTLAPGLRLSWIVCPQEVAGPLVMAKQGADLHTNALSQTIAYEFLRRGWLPEQIQRIRETYRERSQAMIEAIDEYFPKGVYFSRPQGGLFLWVALPPEIDTLVMLPEAIEHQVAYVPGYPFHVTDSGRNTMRLSFASVKPEIIREGIRRLGAIIQRHLR